MAATCWSGSTGVRACYCPTPPCPLPQIPEKLDSSLLWTEHSSLELCLHCIQDRALTREPRSMNVGQRKLGSKPGSELDVVAHACQPSTLGN